MFDEDNDNGSRQLIDEGLDDVLVNGGYLSVGEAYVKVSKRFIGECSEELPVPLGTFLMMLTRGSSRRWMLIPALIPV